MHSLSMTVVTEMPFEHMTNKWDYHPRLSACCVIYFASSLKCRITSSAGGRALPFPVFLSPKRCQGTCQGTLSFTVIPQESSLSTFRHNQDFMFSTYWQLRDRRIRCTLRHLGKTCLLRKQKTIEEVCVFNEMNKSPLGRHCIWMCSKKHPVALSVILVLVCSCACRYI